MASGIADSLPGGSPIKEKTKSPLETMHEMKADKLAKDLPEYSEGATSKTTLGGLEAMVTEFTFKKPGMWGSIEMAGKRAGADRVVPAVGTIRHRAEWYFHTDPPVGIKLGDDADQIDLDMTLERYSIAKEFLLRILADLAHECDVEIAQLMTEGAVDRLVLASGGVARDFLAVFRMSVDVSRERIRLHEQHGNRINVEDVNVAAGEFESSKREEFKRDTSGEDQGLEQEFQRIRNFCLEEAESNCFLLNADAKGSQIDLIHELADLKLLHRARARVSVSGRPGKIFEAYMLDLSQYAGSRKRRGVTVIEFWNPRVVEDLSKVSLIYELAPAGESRSPSPPLARQEHQALDDGPDGDEQQADSASPENGDQPAPSSR